MRNKIILLLLAFLLISPVFAYLGTFKVNECVNIRLLSNCSSVNLSTITLGKDTIVINQEMQHLTGKVFNYTYCNTSEIGYYVYDWDENCIDCSNDLCVNDFDVTNTGKIQSTSQGLGSMSFIILMFGLTVLLGYLGFKFSESKLLWVLGIFFIFLALLFVVYDVFLGFQYYQNYTGEADGGMPQIIFYIFMMLLTAGLMVSMILLFRHWKDWARYIKRELKSKDNDDEFDKDIENF